MITLKYVCINIKPKQETKLLHLIVRMILSRERKGKRKQERKQTRKKEKRFMAAFVCEVVLDLAQCVWAELHFANYFPVAEFSAWHSSPALRREAQR